MEGYSDKLLNVEERPAVLQNKGSHSTTELSKSLINQDKVLESIEDVLVIGFKKLCIDDAEARSSIEKLITDRKSLGIDSTPSDALSAKQNFALQQLKQLQVILERTNNLAEVVDKLKHFEREQLELQKTVQNNYDGMKAVFKKSDIRSGERKRTYLCVNYAEPLSPRESLSIVYDIMDTISRNQTEMQQAIAAKLHMLNDCDLGDVAKNNIQMIQAQMPSLLESVKNAIQDTPESSEIASIQTKLEFETPAEHHAGQTISYFVRHMNGWLPVLFKALKVIHSGLGMNSRLEEDMIDLEDQIAECRLEMRSKDQEIARLKQKLEESSIAYQVPKPFDPEAGEEEDKQEDEQFKDLESEQLKEIEHDERQDQMKDQQEVVDEDKSV